MLRLTLTEILPSSLGKCAARNQSPGSGLVTLKAPVVRFGRVHVRVTAKDPGTTVSRGKRVYKGLITGGAPDLKYLLITKARIKSLFNTHKQQKHLTNIRFIHMKSWQHKHSKILNQKHKKTYPIPYKYDKSQICDYHLCVTSHCHSRVTWDSCSTGKHCLPIC